MVTEKPQSVRSQRSFAEHMKTLYQGIDTMVYAGEVACANTADARDLCCDECPFKNKHFYDSVPPEHDTHPCIVMGIRSLMGDHFPQGDIKEVELSEG